MITEQKIPLEAKKTPFSDVFGEKTHPYPSETKTGLKSNFTLSQFWAYLLDRPSVIEEDRCAVCGKRATNKHHVIVKGMNGLPPQIERRIPLIRLCGNGNTSGCHGLVHQKRLHLYWDEERGGWVYLLTRYPTKYEEAWRKYKDKFKPLPGWVGQKLWGKPIGVGK